MEVTSKRKLSLKNSMKLIEFYLMTKKRLIMIGLAQWMVMVTDFLEGDLDDELIWILVIFSHHSLVEDLVDELELGIENKLVKISR